MVPARQMADGPRIVLYRLIATDANVHGAIEVSTVREDDLAMLKYCLGVGNADALLGSFCLTTLRVGAKLLANR